MPLRDLNGEEIPAGKVHRRREYHAIGDDGSPDWMRLFGDATERSTSIDRGRGELELAVPDGVGGYTFPAVDPSSFREIRVGLAIHDGLTEPNSVAVGFVDDPEEPTNGFRLEQVKSRSELRPARIVRLADGERSVSGDVGSIVGALARADADPDVCAWIEVRMRPFERGETVVFGGAGRGDVAHEANGLSYGVTTPMCPVLAVDTTPARSSDTVGIAKAWFGVLHD